MTHENTAMRKHPRPPAVGNIQPAKGPLREPRRVGGGLENLPHFSGMTAARTLAPRLTEAM